MLDLLIGGNVCLFVSLMHWIFLFHSATTLESYPSSFSFAWIFVFKFLNLISHWTGAWRIVNSHRGITLWTMVSVFTDSFLRASHSLLIMHFSALQLAKFWLYSWLGWFNGCLICWLVDKTVWLSFQMQEFVRDNWQSLVFDLYIVCQPTNCHHHQFLRFVRATTTNALCNELPVG